MKLGLSWIWAVQLWASQRALSFQFPFFSPWGSSMYYSSLEAIQEAPNVEPIHLLSDRLYLSPASLPQGSQLSKALFALLCISPWFTFLCVAFPGLGLHHLNRRSTLKCLIQVLLSRNPRLRQQILQVKSGKHTLKHVFLRWVVFCLEAMQTLLLVVAKQP